MSPFDTEDDDSNSLSMQDLPPSARAQYAQQMQGFGFNFRPPREFNVPQSQPVPAPDYTAQPRADYTAPPPPADRTRSLIPIGTVENVQQAPIYQPVPQPQPPAKDNSAMMFILATAVLGGLGYWAYTKMEKDRRKIRVGPPAGQTADYGDDDDDSDRDDDHGESAAPLDDYEDAGLPEKDVDPHEEGGIKLVKG